MPLNCVFVSDNLMDWFCFCSALIADENDDDNNDDGTVALLKKIISKSWKKKKKTIFFKSRKQLYRHFFTESLCSIL